MNDIYFQNLSCLPCLSCVGYLAGENRIESIGFGIGFRISQRQEVVRVIEGKVLAFHWERENGLLHWLGEEIR
jgi:hypothetical protein